ncbi:hypothetical protein DCS_06827 [Drechmeria coniospora]|uniref:Arginase-like protein n=1 Tax=Drechmeria coniospora TaxID=98403 RepID=A0A151GCN6_DRECN|nr:hypothetical protein DCS_06827 [Drechmeria coniospora]KYK54866.1 hypothetical protein DCS_06827 [Drechmeria coniospora]ODA75902.1 hypothetical protein RJ55_08543 [Drechmeria coniospora]
MADWEKMTTDTTDSLRSVESSSSLGYNSQLVVDPLRTYKWPPWQLNFWIFAMLLASTSIMAVFSLFVQMQYRLLLPVPWYFPYCIVVSIVAIAFLVCIFCLIAHRRLLPAIVMSGAFVLFVLWMVGLVAVSMQLWGPNGSVHGNCSLQVFNRSPTGMSQDTLAWMQQKNICQSWYLVFFMSLAGAMSLVWVMVMAYQVYTSS